VSRSSRDNARSNLWSGSVVIWSASSLRSVAVLVESNVERWMEEEEKRRAARFKESSNFVKLVFR